MRFGEGRSNAATVAEICLAHYGIDDIQAIPDAVHKPAIDKTDIAALAKPVLDAAGDGLVEAQEIVRNQARLLADTTVVGLASMTSQAPVVGCFGGVFNNRFYLTEFSTHVRASMRTQEIRVITDGSSLAGIFRLLIAGIAAPRSSMFHSSSVEFFDRQIANLRH
jgi:N-acetylglucosamine kinase-like BadF-type ATPase